MWIMTTGGFYSAVQKGSDPTVLTVRTRSRDAAQLAIDAIEMEFGESVRLVVGEGTDYAYRFEVSRENFARWVQHEIMNFLDYSNFKDAAAATNGQKSGYVHALTDTWTAMLEATDEEGKQYGIYAPKHNPHYGRY